MSSIVDDPRLLRERAKQAREIAARSDDPVVQDALTTLAEEFEKLAAMAERRH
jgi:DNA-binding ferritin-like protein